MQQSTLFNLSAIAALAPAAIASWRRPDGRDGVFWLLVAVAAVGPLTWVVWRLAGGWHGGLADTLWVTVAITVALFAVIAALSREGWRLATLLFPYLILLSLIATVWTGTSEVELSAGLPETWIIVHIAVSVLTYGLLTIAAVAGLAVLLREHSMKAKTRGALSDRLPSIAGAESLQVALLAWAEGVLGIGVLTGMATQFLASGSILLLDHKTLFTIGGFVLIGGLLAAHLLTGLRGRRAARLALVAYLLVTLGYPGVKFVRDVLLA